MCGINSNDQAISIVDTAEMPFAVWRKGINFGVSIVKFVLATSKTSP
jgi:hypothetical protein